MGASVELRGVVVRFGERAVLDGVDLSLTAGEVVALLGASGSGKSTLLRVIAGLIDLDDGSVHIDGVDMAGVPTHRRGVGMVFQDNQLFTNLDVAGNIGYGLRSGGSAKRRRRVGELLQLVGLHRVPDIERRAVTTLSGGEAKRVALARSLATAPRVLLLDEPLTGLDAELRERLADDLATILTDRGVTAVLVTHDRSEAERIASRVIDIADLSAGGEGGAGYTDVELVAAHELFALRRAVLRAGTPSDDVQFPGDDDAVHMAIRDRSGAIAAAASWFLVESPDAPGEPALQLRGMAVAPSARRRGLGERLISAGAELATRRGTAVLWANARDTALDFYRAAGFTVVGEGFVSADTALPHHRIIARVGVDRAR